MKNLSIRWGRLCYIVIFASLLFISCKKDDNGLQAELQNEHEHQNHSSSQRVDAADIPDIMDFVRQQSNGDLTLNLQGRPGTREPDLTDVEVITSNILAMTNEAEMTNYSFNMDATEANDGDVVNFVVKENSDGVYGYIIRYRPTEDWLVTSDWSQFSGDMLFYESDGTYVAMQTLENGAPTTRDLVFPCEGGGSTGGSSGGSGPGNSGNGSNGSGSNGGSGGGGTHLS